MKRALEILAFLAMMALPFACYAAQCISFGCPL